MRQPERKQHERFAIVSCRQQGMTEVLKCYCTWQETGRLPAILPRRKIGRVFLEHLIHAHT